MDQKLLSYCSDDYIRWSAKEVYNWSMKLDDGDQFAQILLDQQVKGTHLKSLTYQKLTDPNGVYKIKGGPAESLLAGINSLTGGSDEGSESALPMVQILSLLTELKEFQFIDDIFETIHGLVSLTEFKTKPIIDNINSYLSELSHLFQEKMEKRSKIIAILVLVLGILYLIIHKVK